MPGGFPGEGDDKGKYVRVMKSLDVSDEASVAKVSLSDSLASWMVDQLRFGCLANSLRSGDGRARGGRIEIHRLPRDRRR